MHTLQLSIITVNLNNSSGLNKTLQSIKEQSFKSYEHIIIDGNSIDDSKNIISKYSQTSTHVTYWISEKDNGIYNAMNKGIVHANGEYILFLNSGDYLEPEVLQTISEQLTGEDIIYGDLYFVSKQEERRLQRFNYPDLSTTRILQPNFCIPHPASFIKRKLFDKEQYNEQYKIVSDWEFFIKNIIFENKTTKYVSLAISNFIDGGVSSLESNETLIRHERDDVICKMFPPKVLESLNRLSNIEQSPLYEILSQEKYSKRFQKKVKKIIQFYCKVYNLFNKTGEKY